MQYRMAEDLALQGIDQGLELNAAHAYPSAQGGAGNSKAGARKDALLAVQRKVVRVLGHQHLGQQPGCGNLLVNDLSGTGAWVKVWHLLQAYLPRMWRSTVNTPGV